MAKCSIKLGLLISGIVVCLFFAALAVTDTIFYYSSRPIHAEASSYKINLHPYPDVEVCVDYPIPTSLLDALGATYQPLIPLLYAMFWSEDPLPVAIINAMNDTNMETLFDQFMDAKPGFPADKPFSVESYMTMFASLSESSVFVDCRDRLQQSACNSMFKIENKGFSNGPSQCFYLKLKGEPYRASGPAGGIQITLTRPDLADVQKYLPTIIHGHQVRFFSPRPSFPVLVYPEEEARVPFSVKEYHQLHHCDDFQDQGCLHERLGSEIAYECGCIPAGSNGTTVCDNMQKIRCMHGRKFEITGRSHHFCPSLCRETELTPLTATSRKASYVGKDKSAIFFFLDSRITVYHEYYVLTTWQLFASLWLAVSFWLILIYCCTTCAVKECRHLKGQEAK